MNRGGRVEQVDVSRFLVDCRRARVPADLRLALNCLMVSPHFSPVDVGTGAAKLIEAAKCLASAAEAASARGYKQLPEQIGFTISQLAPLIEAALSMPNEIPRDAEDQPYRPGVD